MKKAVPKRCSWVSSATTTSLYKGYHDTEWGTCTTVSRHDGHQLFELVCLEAQQAGLSWYTVLVKRNAYRRAFFNFEPSKVARMSVSTDVPKLLHIPSPQPSLKSKSKSKPKPKPKAAPEDSVIRHQGKLEAIIHNAHAYRRLTEVILKERKCAYTGKAASAAFADFLWSFAYCGDDCGQCAGKGHPSTPPQKKVKGGGGCPNAAPREDNGCAAADDEVVRLRYAQPFALARMSEADPSPTQTNASVALSRALKVAGFNFFGPTTAYAFMQAAGMVNDHSLDCDWFKNAEAQRLKVFKEEDPCQLWTVSAAIRLAEAAAAKTKTSSESRKRLRS